MKPFFRIPALLFNLLVLPCIASESSPHSTEAEWSALGPTYIGEDINPKILEEAIKGNEAYRLQVAVGIIQKYSLLSKEELSNHLKSISTKPDSITQHLEQLYSDIESNLEQVSLEGFLSGPDPASHLKEYLLTNPTFAWQNSTKYLMLNMLEKEMYDCVTTLNGFGCRFIDFRQAVYSVKESTYPDKKSLVSRKTFEDYNNKYVYKKELDEYVTSVKFKDGIEREVGVIKGSAFSALYMRDYDLFLSKLNTSSKPVKQQVLDLFRSYSYSLNHVRFIAGSVSRGIRSGNLEAITLDADDFYTMFRLISNPFVSSAEIDMVFSILSSQSRSELANYSLRAQFDYFLKPEYYVYFKQPNLTLINCAGKVLDFNFSNIENFHIKYFPTATNSLAILPLSYQDWFYNPGTLCGIYNLFKNSNYFSNSNVRVTFFERLKYLVNGGTGAQFRQSQDAAESLLCILKTAYELDRTKFLETFLNSGTDFYLNSLERLIMKSKNHLNFLSNRSNTDTETYDVDYFALPFLVFLLDSEIEFIKKNFNSCDLLAEAFGSDVLGMLLEYGIDPNELSSVSQEELAEDPVKVHLRNGILSRAILNESFQDISVLLSYGADPNIERKQLLYSPTALDFFASGVVSDDDIAILLLQHGADPALKNQVGKSSIDYAASENNLRFLELLKRPLPTKVSKDQFINKVRQKYPEYSDLSDDSLFELILSKYPEYKSSIK